jgi:NAD(P)-dependent dehydrogenase (short-subunit alcohol dehydrogenase family)
MKVLLFMFFVVALVLPKTMALNVVQGFGKGANLRGKTSLAAGLMGPKTTALEVVQEYGRGANLQGKTALVTGANSGIGLELTKRFAEAGCKVICCVRDVKKGSQSIKEVMDSEGAASLCNVQRLDLSSLSSVQECSQRILSTCGDDTLDLVINNAGIMATPTLRYTEDGFELQSGTNHFGHAYLNSLLYEKLCDQNVKSRVVTLASTAHAFGTVDLDDLHYKSSRLSYTPWGAYGRSKLLNLLYAKGLAAKLKDDGFEEKIMSVSVHPGVIRTNLWRETPLKFSGLGFLSSAVGFMDKTIAQGAATTAWAALSPRLDTEGSAFQGAYLSDCGPANPTNKQAFDAELPARIMVETERQIAEALAKLGAT